MKLDLSCRNPASDYISCCCDSTKQKPTRQVIGLEVGKIFSSQLEIVIS